MKLSTQTVRVDDIKEHIARVLGGFHKDEGLQFGTIDANVRKIVVCWMADYRAIDFAGSIGANLIIAHESLFYPYDVIVNGGVSDFMTWPVNRNRIKRLAEHNISVIRAHGSLDTLCILDDFALNLGLGKPVVSEAEWVNIYEIEPVTYHELVEKVKLATGIKSLRVTDGDRNRMVKRIGLPWGGMALFVNVGYMQKLLKHGCDVFIAGETDNYGLRFAVDSGVDMIETSHEVSENPGLKHFAEILANDFPQIKVEFYENEMLWVNE